MTSKIFTMALMLALLSCDGCKKDDPKPLTELEKLPPATQTGKYTFGCLVNGKAWVTQTTLDATAVYQQGNLQIGGQLFSPTQVIGLSIVEQGGILIQNGNYSLIDLPYNTADVTIWKDLINSCMYDAKATYEGTLMITKMDRINYIVSGTFNFSTVTSGCDTLRITNGRFDIKYIP